MEVLDAANIKKVSQENFLNDSFNEVVYTQISSGSYNRKKDGTPYVNTEFHQHPERFDGDFLKYAEVSEILIVT